MIAPWKNTASLSPLSPVNIALAAQTPESPAPSSPPPNSKLPAESPQSVPSLPNPILPKMKQKQLALAKITIPSKVQQKIDSTTQQNPGDQLPVEVPGLTLQGEVHQANQGPAASQNHPHSALTQLPEAWINEVEQREIAARVRTYVVGKGCLGKIQYLLNRIWNAIKAIFGRSDWQIAQKIIVKNLAGMYLNRILQEKQLSER